MKNADLKKRILEISYKLQLSHLGSCLTSVDIIDEIYSMKKPDEKVIISNGHAHLAHAVVMEKYWPDSTGITRFDPEENIKKYGIHCERAGGCDCSTGSLGQGISIACGMALADRSKKVYCLVSDGECSEGSLWESLRIAHEQDLSNLKVYLNYNGWGAYKKIGKIYFDPRYKLTGYYTNMNGWPSWLQGQQAHYVVMDDNMYQEALLCL